jgi:cell division protein FtsI/penicillin-binding protein 2
MVVCGSIQIALTGTLTASGRPSRYMRSLREEPVAVERGMITDREGRPLAVSVPVSAKAGVRMALYPLGQFPEVEMQRFGHRLPAGPVAEGMITDREGRPLAVSVPVSAIWIDPQTTMEKGGVARSRRRLSPWWSADRSRSR